MPEAAWPGPAAVADHVEDMAVLGKVVCASHLPWLGPVVSRPRSCPSRRLAGTCFQTASDRHRHRQLQPQPQRPRPRHLLCVADLEADPSQSAFWLLMASLASVEVKAGPWQPPKPADRPCAAVHVCA